MNGPAAQRLPAPPQADQVPSRPKVTPTSSPAGRRTNLVRPSSVPLAAASQAPTGSPVMVRPSVSMAERTEAPPIVRDVLRSSGKPLDPGVRASMESSFGHDLTRVRIHDDKPAAASAQAVGATAYTVGDHVVFGQGKFDSGSSHGRQLLGHELAHVLQQRNGAGLIAAGQPTAHSERTADAAGLAAARGASAGPVGATCVALARQPQPAKANVMEPREAVSVLLALPAFQFAADPSAGAMDVIAEVLEGPRTMENAVQRRLRLRAACSVLDPDSAAAVRMALTRPATAKQRRLHESFGMLHHAIRAELLEILSARASGATTPGPQGSAAAREPDLSKLPPTAEDLARTIRRLPASHSDQEVANFVALALRDLSPEDPATYQPVLAALADTRPAVFKVIAAWLARGRGASAARLQAQQEEQFKRDLELAQRSPGLLHMFIPGSMYTYRDLSSQIHNPYLRFTAHANIVEASREAHRRLAGYGEAAKIIAALYLAAMVAPAVAEAAPAVSEAASNISLRAGVALTSYGATGARIIGTTLSLAGGALRALPGSALQFYLSHPILVNEIGLFSVETVLSVDGDLPGLLKMLSEDPVQAAQFFLQVWVIHMSARTPAGDSYDVEIHARPLPIEEQTGPALRLKPVSAPTVTPVPEPSAAVGGPGTGTSRGGAGTGQSGPGIEVTHEAAVVERPTKTAARGRADVAPSVSPRVTGFVRRDIAPPADVAPSVSPRVAGFVRRDIAPPADVAPSVSPRVAGFGRDIESVPPHGAVPQEPQVTTKLPSAYVEPSSPSDPGPGAGIGQRSGQPAKAMAGKRPGDDEPGGPTIISRPAQPTATRAPEVVDLELESIGRTGARYKPAPKPGVDPYQNYIRARDSAARSSGLGAEQVPHFVESVGPGNAHLVGRRNGYMSPDGTRGWRLDYSPRQGTHINWWRTEGGVRYQGAISVGADEATFLRLLDGHFGRPPD